MQEERVSYELALLNKRYLDFYNSFGVYEERRNVKSILKTLKKYASGKRWIELRTIARGYFNRRQNKENANAKELESHEFDPSLKVAVYSCIIGGYDDVKEPAYINKQCCDFYMVTDGEVGDESAWKKIDINEIHGLDGLDNRGKARYVKTHPHVLFPEYDYSVWIDGSLKVIADVMPIIGSMGEAWFGVHTIQNGIDCVYDSIYAEIAEKAEKGDILRQIRYYKRQGYPAHNGMYETGVLIRKHNNDRCIKTMEYWWKQMSHFTLRDQMSINYVLWKNKISESEIYILGDNVYMNPRFFWEPHKMYRSEK